MKASRPETTAELSRAVLAKLRREFTLVATEVAVSDASRVDFVAFRPAKMEAMPAALERGTFCFAQVKSCMADFESGHGLTFQGDENWLVCPKGLAQKLREEGVLPYGVRVLCPDSAGRLKDFPNAGTARGVSARVAGGFELLWRMANDSGKSWRATRPVFEDLD